MLLQLLMPALSRSLGDRGSQALSQVWGSAETGLVRCDMSTWVTEQMHASVWTSGN